MLSLIQTKLHVHDLVQLKAITFLFARVFLLVSGIR